MALLTGAHTRTCPSIRASYRQTRGDRTWVTKYLSLQTWIRREGTVNTANYGHGPAQMSLPAAIHDIFKGPKQHLAASLFMHFAQTLRTSGQADDSQ